MPINKPLVSIIIPTYNRESYLVEAVDSVLKQTYENIEIIVSDNASTDNTKEVMKQYKNNSKVKYFRNDKNIGMAPNWRKALYEYANGDFAMILSDDDYLVDSTYIEEAIKSINKCNSKLVFSNCLQVFEENKKIVKEDLVEYDLPECNNGKDLFFLWRKKEYTNSMFFSFMLQTVVFDRKLAISFNAFQNEILSADFELWLNFLASNINVSFINKIGAIYRIHANNEASRNNYTYGMWLDNFKCWTEPEKIALKFYNSEEVKKHTNWLIRESFSEWPGKFVTLHNIKILNKELNNYPRLKKEFYKTLILYPKALFKLILSSNDYLYNGIRKIYWKYIKKEKLVLKEKD